MPSTGNNIVIKHGTLAQYLAATKNADTIYFITDAQKVFVGETEYTRQIENLTDAPTGTGVEGKLYHYNGTLYIYSGSGYVKVANYNDKVGTVTSVIAGEGLTGGTISATGTIAHATPEEKTATSGDRQLGWDSETNKFEVYTPRLDKFGHVECLDKMTYMMPKEPEISIASIEDDPVALKAGQQITVMTDVAKDADSTHALTKKLTKFTLPEDENTTYTLAKGTTDGSVKLVSSDGTEVHADVVIQGWGDLAKKSDISAVLKFKGSVANEAALPESATVGDVYHVTDTQGEFVYTEDGWEELGITVSLEGYATSTDVENALKDYMKLVPTAGENKIAVFDENGQVVAGAKTIDELITQLTYEHPTHEAHPSGLYKVTVDDKGHVSAVDLVSVADIDDLGPVNSARRDGYGNLITDTYATKEELQAAGLKWQAI